MSRRLAFGVVAVVAAVVGVWGVGSPAQASAPACSTVGLTVSALHGPNFYVDTSSSPVLRGAYAGYRVTDTSGTARSDVWVQLSNFTGGSVTLGTGQPNAQQIPTLAANASASRFFYLTAQAQSSTAQQHAVSVWRGRPDLPGSAQLCADSGGFSSVQETIKAAANKLTSVTVSAGTPKIGGTFTITVQGDTGTIGSGSANDPSSFWMSPAASGSWPAGAYRLIGTSLSFAGGASYTDTLRVSGLSSPSKAYTAVYTFRAVGFTSSPTSILPVQQIASGTQIKHTDLGSIASLPAITPSTNDLTIAMTASPPKLPDTGGTATYQVPVSGSAGAVLDSFTATVPAGVTLVPGSVQWNGTTVRDGVATGGTIVFSGPYALTGTGDTLTFDSTLPAVSGDRSTSSVATVGSATIDTTLALTDNAPATSTVNVNTFPNATNDTVTVADNRSSTIAVAANDTDPDGDQLTVTAVGTATNGTVTLTGGAVDYTPANGYTGADSFTYTVDDGRGGTDTATVNLSVVTPSGPPAQATNDTATAVAGSPTAVDVLNNDTGQQLTVTAVSSPAHGTVTIAADGSNVTYTAATGYSGSDTFTYTATDLSGTTTTGTVTVTVTAATTPPAPTPLTAAGDTANTAAGAPVTVSPLANDTGDGPLALQSVGVAGHGAVSVAGNDVIYQPVADYWGTDSFTYTVADVHGATDTATVTVTVTARPGPAGDTATIAFGTPTIVNALANDPNGATIARIVTAPAHGTATIDAGGALHYTPAAGYTGPDTFTYRLIGSPSAATVSVNVAAPFLAASGDTISVARSSTIHVDVLANDTGTGLNIDHVDPAAHGSTELRSDGIWYTANATYKGTDTFTYTVRDAAGLTANATVQVTIANDGPTIEPVAPRTVVAGATITVPFTVSDPNADPFTLSTGTPTGPTGAATWTRRTTTGSTVTVTTNVALSGNVTIPVTVSDGEGTATTHLRLTVRPAPAVTVRGRILPNPEARAGLRNPSFANGRPVSRTLSTRIDSQVTWRVSPTTTVVGYQVTLNGARVCTTPAIRSAAIQSCRLNAVALHPGDAVRVIAVGADHTLSNPAGASLLPTAAANRLLAVVYFPSGEFFLDPTARRVLAGVARQARTYGFTTAAMVGHTDSDSSADFNLALSRQRATQVAAYFHRAYPTLRATHTGYGETQPALPNTTGRDKAANRRVEIYVG